MSTSVRIATNTPQHRMHAERFNTLEECPRVLLHVDADSFFASCEQAVHPELRGKPVVTGLERGIVSAASYEAKAFGVKRGVTLWEVRTLCPQAVILPSDYELYSVMSKRLFAILRRFTPHVEEYSIDEAFLDVTGYHHAYNSSYEQLGAAMKHAVESEMGLTVSFGFGQTKVLTKVASNWAKPSGLTLIHPPQVPDYLAQRTVEQLWGIGRRMGRRLRSRGIGTALELYQRPEGWANQFLYQPQRDMWYELHGYNIFTTNDAPKDSYDSISKTRTFTPSSTDRSYIFAQLAKNLENACIKARRYQLGTTQFGIFLKRQNFSYQWNEGTVLRLSAYPVDMIATLKKLFDDIFEPGTPYRATGVVLLHLQPNNPHQLSLFEKATVFDERSSLYTHIDALADTYGKHTVFLGATLPAMTMLDERMEHRRRGATLTGNGSTLRDTASSPHTSRQNSTTRTAYTRRFVGIPVAGTAQ